MFGALCHDLGKPSTTVTERGHVRSPTHDVAGVPIGRALLERWRASNELIARVGALTEHHLAPALFVKGAAGPHGYRKLARKLGEANVTLELLARLARADHLGRTTPEALAGDTALVEQFLARAHELTIVHEAPRDAVLGRHLIARGMKPGPRFGEILARCREVQDETGSTDPDQILALVLGTSSSEPASEG
jgi:tRNA nucleotidyltransferase (CCA-adding enzyme)